MAKSPTVGIRLTGDASGLVRASGQGRAEMEKSRKAMRQTQRDAQASGAAMEKWSTRLNQVKGAMAAVGLMAGAMKLGQMGKDALQLAEDTERTAMALGTTAERVQELTYVFRSFGADQADVSDALSTLADRAEGAVAGTKSMIQDFGLLGIQVDQLRGKRPDELFDLFARGVAATEDPTRRAAGVVRLLGDDLGRRLMPALMQGEEGLARMSQEARDVGAVMSDELITKGAEANREMDKLAITLQTRMNVALVENSETITSVGNAFAWAAGKGLEFVEVLGKGLGLALGEALHGPDDPIGQIERRILEAQAKLDTLTPIGIPAQMYRERREALEKELAGYRKVLDNLRKEAAKPTSFLGGGSKPGAAPAKPSGGGGNTTVVDPAAAEAAKRLNELFRRRLADLQRERVLLDDNTAAARLRWELEHGELAKLSPKRQELLKTAAAQLDADKAAAEARRELARQQEEAERESQRRMQEWAAENERLVESLRTPAEVLRDELDDLNARLEVSGISYETWARGVEAAHERAAAAANKNKDEISDTLKEIRDAAQGVGRELEDAFVTMAKEGKFSFKDMATSIMADILRIVVRAQIIRPLMAGLGSMFPGVFGSKSADGNVFAHGNVVPFAAGGVVAGPTVFPMPGGRTGLMGEAGPEAIMPLKRGADGKLGVAASGGGGTVVQIIDQRGAGAPAVEISEGRGPDGRRMITALVRAEVQSYLNSGGLDRTMLANFGVRRRPA